MRPYAVLLLLCLSACATRAPGKPSLPADKALAYCEASLGPAPAGGWADYLTQCMQDKGYMPSDHCIQAMDRAARERLLRDPRCFTAGHNSVGQIPVS
jgi:hypothetical protein